MNLNIFKWFKSIFGKKKSTDIVNVKFRLPSGKEFYVECYKLEYRPNLECKLHRSYIPIHPPDVDCETCWKIYNLKT